MNSELERIRKEFVVSSFSELFWHLLAMSETIREIYQWQYSVCLSRFEYSPFECKSLQLTCSAAVVLWTIRSSHLHSIFYIPPSLLQNPINGHRKRADTAENTDLLGFEVFMTVKIY
jgi:hypothetical protein